VAGLAACDVANADLVIEAVPKMPAIKSAAYRNMAHFFLSIPLLPPTFRVYWRRPGEREWNGTWQ
jgi:hypothetical protein